MIKRTKTVRYSDNMQTDDPPMEQSLPGYESSTDNNSTEPLSPQPERPSAPEPASQDHRRSQDLRLATEDLQQPLAAGHRPPDRRHSMREATAHDRRLSMLEKAIMRGSWVGDRYLPREDPAQEVIFRGAIGHEERVRNVRIYRDLVGITSPPEIRDSTSRASIRSYLCFRRPAKNAGYYQSILDEEFKATIWYHTSTWVSNVLLALQIAIAATLTALGVSASHSRGTAITVLGGVNTAVATTLAYLKAKGLPMRALVYKNDLRRLREHIEYMERQFELGINPRGLDPVKVVAGYRDTYDKVQKVQQKHETDAQIGALSAHPAGKVGTPVDIKTPKNTREEANGTSVTNPRTGEDAAQYV